ncbi:MAG: hypothetical protein ACYTG6_14055 [Planctomycetota bacterium]|jgi:hypothetical protein
MPEKMRWVCVLVPEDLPEVRVRTATAGRRRIARDDARARRFAHDGPALVEVLPDAEPI